MAVYEANVKTSLPSRQVPAPSTRSHPRVTTGDSTVVEYNRCGHVFEAQARTMSREAIEPVNAAVRGWRAPSGRWSAHTAEFDARDLGRERRRVHHHHPSAGTCPGNSTGQPHRLEGRQTSASRWRVERVPHPKLPGRSSAEPFGFRWVAGPSGRQCSEVAVCVRGAAPAPRPPRRSSNRFVRRPSSVLALHQWEPSAVIPRIRTAGQGCPPARWQVCQARRPDEA
jgi:hypothetical protein